MSDTDTPSAPSQADIAAWTKSPQAWRAKLSSLVAFDAPPNEIPHELRAKAIEYFGTLLQANEPPTSALQYKAWQTLHDDHLAEQEANLKALIKKQGTYVGVWRSRATYLIETANSAGESDWTSHSFNEAMDSLIRYGHNSEDAGKALHQARVNRSQHIDLSTVVAGMPRGVHTSHDDTHILCTRGPDTTTSTGNCTYYQNNIFDLCRGDYAIYDRLCLAWRYGLQSLEKGQWCVLPILIAIGAEGAGKNLLAAMIAHILGGYRSANATTLLLNPAGNIAENARLASSTCWAANDVPITTRKQADLLFGRLKEAQSNPDVEIKKLYADVQELRVFRQLFVSANDEQSHLFTPPSDSDSGFEKKVIAWIVGKAKSLTSHEESIRLLREQAPAFRHYLLHEWNPTVPLESITRTTDEGSKTGVREYWDPQLLEQNAIGIHDEVGVFFEAVHDALDTFEQNRSTNDIILCRWPIAARILTEASSSAPIRSAFSDKVNFSFLNRSWRKTDPSTVRQVSWSQHRGDPPFWAITHPNADPGRAPLTDAQLDEHARILYTGDKEIRSDWPRISLGIIDADGELQPSTFK